MSLLSEAKDWRNLIEELGAELDEMASFARMRLADDELADAIVARADEICELGDKMVNAARG